jgi:hypothetical protein
MNIFVTGGAGYVGSHAAAGCRGLAMMFGYMTTSRFATVRRFFPAG